MTTDLLKLLFECYIIVATYRHNYLYKCTVSLPTHLPELPEPPQPRAPHWPVPVTIRIF
jgi:hypothetical protein